MAGTIVAFVGKVKVIWPARDVTDGAIRIEEAA
jgi:hypothetical protein